MSSSIILREHSLTFPRLLCSLTFLRYMGGGPRTFPGGLNKWQWKRLHEKKAREKEKRLLDQEKQLYQARIRSQIRAKLAGQPSAYPHSDQSYGPMSPKDHIKALADRFMKAGAEDLWNEADGPVESSAVSNDQSSRMRINGQDKPLFSMNLNDSRRPQQYTVYNRSQTGSGVNFLRNKSSSDEEDSDTEGVSKLPSIGKAELKRFNSKWEQWSDGECENKQ